MEENEFNSANCIMDAHFELLLKSLRLTTRQKEDAKKKYDGIAKSLHTKYYDTEYNGKSKYLIGSFAKHTNIRPPSDVDVLFKIPKEVLERYKQRSGNGPADLLQDVKKILDNTYPLTEKHGWIKVIAIEFGSGQHRVEVLPAFERDDGKFIIPNSYNGGSWDIYDARKEVEKIKNADVRTKALIKFLKHWRDGSMQNLSSYEIEDAVLLFGERGNKTVHWLETVKEFFEWFSSASKESCAAPIKTALKRINKAITYVEKSQYCDACTELRKVFPLFPGYDKNLVRDASLEEKYPSEAEKYIEELVDDIQIQDDIVLKIQAIVNPDDDKGYLIRPNRPLCNVIQDYGAVPIGAKIRFTPKTTYSGDIYYKWKIRNFGEDASRDDGLRGEIRDGDEVNGGILESTKYECQWHYVECYMIENNICIARTKMFIPIGKRRK